MRTITRLNVIISAFVLGIAATILSSNCNDDLQRIKFAYASANYDALYRYINEAYSHCKGDCNYINYYLFFNMASTNDRYNSIQKGDIERGNNCASDEKANWQKLYYLRQLDASSENREKTVPIAFKDKFDEIYSFALEPHNKVIIDDIMLNKSGKYFGSVYGAYYLYINDLKEEALEMMSVPYGHAMRSPLKSQSLFATGIWQALINDMMMLEVIKMELTEKQIAKIKDMCANMPFLMKIYYFKIAESHCPK